MARHHKLKLHNLVIIKYTKPNPMKINTLFIVALALGLTNSLAIAGEGEGEPQKNTLVGKQSTGESLIRQQYIAKVSTRSTNPAAVSTSLASRKTTPYPRGVTTVQRVNLRRPTATTSPSTTISTPAPAATSRLPRQ